MPSRREHSKSRRGCSQCKARRIKCDETPPCCGPCSRKKIQCDYQELATSFHEFSADDLGLMHHFTLQTSQTLGVIDDDIHRSFWQTQAPKLAIKYNFLIHALLSITAAHIAASEADRRLEYLHISRASYGKALASFRSSVQRVNAERLDAVYCFSVLIMLITFSYGVIDQSPTRDPIMGIVEVFGVVRTGAHTMPLSGKREAFQGTQVGRLMHHMDNITPHRVPDPVQTALDQVTKHIATTCGDNDTRRRIILQEALERLYRFFTLIDLRPPNSAFLLQWPIFLPADFLDFLARKDHPALAMLAFWCVPVHNSPSRWFLGQSMKSVLGQIARVLDGTVWRDMITWPLEQVSQESP